MKTGHTRTFGRRAGRASRLSLVPAGGGWKARARSPCCAAASPGRAAPSTGNSRPASSANGRRLGSSRWRTARRAECGWSRPKRFNRSTSCPRAQRRRLPRPCQHPSGDRSGTLADPRPHRRRSLLVASGGGRFAPGRGAISGRAGDRDRRRRGCTSDSFDMVLGRNRELLYAGLDRASASDLQLVRWSANGRSEWIDAANADKPAAVYRGLTLPVAGHITSYFGYRYHPIACTSRASTPGSTSAPAGQPDRRGRRWRGGRRGLDGGLWPSGPYRPCRGPHQQLQPHERDRRRAGQLRPCRPAHRLCRLVQGLSTGPHVHYRSSLAALRSIRSACASQARRW